MVKCAICTPRRLPITKSTILQGPCFSFFCTKTSELFAAAATAPYRCFLTTCFVLCTACTRCTTGHRGNDRRTIGFTVELVTVELVDLALVSLELIVVELVSVELVVVELVTVQSDTEELVTP